MAGGGHPENPWDASVRPESDEALAVAAAQGSGKLAQCVSQHGSSDEANGKTAARFLGTDNPRHLRVIQAVTVRPVPREELDRVAGCSNGPALVADLHDLGLELPCTRTKKLDRDMFDCWPGVYHLTERDRRRLNAWKRERAAGRVQS